MADFKLVPVPGLRSFAPIAHAGGRTSGVIVGERTNVSLCSVLVRKGAEAQLADRLRGELGLDLPRAPKYVKAGAMAVAWAGADHWFLMEEGAEIGALERRLRTALANTASVVDQSDGRTMVRIGGPRVREALAKGILIDLHPRAFGPGDAAATTIAHINAHFWQVDDRPTYEFAVFRSFAIAFGEWIATSGAEYGVAAER